MQRIAVHALVYVGAGLFEKARDIGVGRWDVLRATDLDAVVLTQLAGRRHQAMHRDAVQRTEAVCVDDVVAPGVRTKMQKDPGLDEARLPSAVPGGEQRALVDLIVVEPPSTQGGALSSGAPAQAPCRLIDDGAGHPIVLEPHIPGGEIAGLLLALRWCHPRTRTCFSEQPLELLGHQPPTKTLVIKLGNYKAGAQDGAPAAPGSRQIDNAQQFQIVDEAVPLPTPLVL